MSLYLEQKFSRGIFNQILARSKEIYNTNTFGDNQNDSDELYILCTRDYKCAETSCTLNAYLDKQNRDLNYGIINTLHLCTFKTPTFKYANYL